MTTDYETFYLRQIGIQRLAQIIFETRAVQSATHTDNAVFGKARYFMNQISHRIHRVTYTQDNSIGRIFQNILYDRLHDAGIHSDQLLASHTRFTGNTRGDNNHIRIGGSLIVVGHSFDTRCETCRYSSLHHIHSLAFRYTFFNIEQNDFVCNFSEC